MYAAFHPDLFTLQFLQRNVGKVSNTIIHVTNGNEIFFFFKKKTITFLSTSIEL